MSSLTPSRLEASRALSDLSRGARIKAGELVSGVTYFPPPPGTERWPHVSKWHWDHWAYWLHLSSWSPAQIAQYQKDRDAFGVGLPTVDKRGHVIKDKPIKWLYRPTPKGVLLHNAKAPNVLWGGAAGGAKSTGLRWDAIMRCLMLGGYRVLLMRRLATELFEHHLDLARREVEPFGARVVENEIRFPNGSLIRGGHCQHPGDELRFLSIEYDCIDIDELATFEQSQANEIMSRSRTTKEGVQAFVRCTSNPGGAHTVYVVDRWITKTVSAEDDPFYDPEDFTYIPARLYDNPYLMDPDGSFRTYEKRLGPLPPQRRDQLLNGDWSAITGQFFPEYKDRDVGQGGHIRRIEVPRDCRIVRAIDWGYNNPGCCLWLALLPDGHVHVAAEYRFTQTLAADVAEKIDRETKDRGWNPAYSVIDPSTFNKTGHSGESVAETFARNKVPCQAGDNARTLGWQRLRHWLAMAPDGIPWITIDPGCRYLRRTLPSLISDARDPEDVNCWVAGTLISTPTGPCPIEDLVPGNLVSTPIGPRTVLNAYISGTSCATVITLADGRVLRGTGHHPVFVCGKGLMPLADLCCGDELLEQTRWSKWWSIAAVSIGGIRDACTTVPLVPCFSKEAQVCIVKSGWMRVVTFLQAITSTISTVITTTTPLRILPVSMGVSTVPCTVEYVTVVRLDNSSRHGVSRTLAAPHSATTHEKCASALRDRNRRAIIVAALSWHDYIRSIARKSARPIIASLRFHVRSAGKRFGVPDKWRPARIVAVGHSDASEPVYNLTVADAHLFYANSVLSSNTEGDDHAADSLRYAIMSRPSPSRSPLQSAPGPGTVGYLKAHGDRHPGSRYWRKTPKR